MEKKEKIENVENVEVKENAEKESVLMIEREPYKSKKDGQEYFNYFIKGIIKGKEVKTAVVPVDKGGYQLLDIIFLTSDACPLKVKPFEITNEKTGEVVSGNTYAVSLTNENGKEFELKIKPASDSGKTIIAYLLG